MLFLGLTLPFVFQLNETALNVGDVASRDILAPFAHSFESALLTEQQRQQAVQQVTLVYTPADPSIGRRQLELLQATLAYITSVRADSYASTEQKLADLSMLENIYLQQASATAILGLSDTRWQTVQQEAIVVLEQVMRNTIRFEQLGSARRNVPAVVNFSLSEEQAALVADLASAFVAPNSVFDEQATELARQEARDKVKPVMRFYIADEAIIQHGQVISEVDLEALQAYGLVQTSGRLDNIGGSAVLTFLAAAFFVLYFYRNPTLAYHLRALTLLFLMFGLFFLGGRVIIPGHTVIPYIYPLIAYSLTVSMLWGGELAMVSVLPLALLTCYGLPNPLELTLFYTISSLFGVLVLRSGRRLVLFFWAALAAALAGILLVIAYRISQPSTDWIGLVTLAMAIGFNAGISASLSILLMFFLSQVMGQVTAMQLIELSRPDHPLVKFMLQNAPGTYQHSLQVAALAEQAAERIGADALLVRVGAIYHDAGKASNPGFFIENQLAGDLNPHHNIEPATGAVTIIRHVADGLELAQKYHLPLQIQAFIVEHHGTLLTRYQYIRAVEAAGGDESLVNVNLFRYPGPRPQTRETALLMLADGCEARVRADRPKDENELREVIRSVIDDRVKNRQMDDTTLTIKDLDTIVDAFAVSLRGVYHPRIQYPTLDRTAAPPASSSSAPSGNTP